jgi:transposase
MKTFRQYDMDQQMLLPPDLREWLRADHLALYVSDVVDELDLVGIMRAYEEGDMRGRPPYHPAMMVKLLVYGYCTGKSSSRKIEQATYDDVAFRVLSCNQQPDHDSIAEFRKRHLKELGKLFVQVLQMCRKTGMVKLGHVAIDGTKMRANAAKRESLTYERMSKVEKELEAEVAKMLTRAQQVDDEEDRLYGRGVRGDELPEELRERETRLEKIREAKRQLESEMKEEAERERIENEEQKEAKERGEPVFKNNRKRKWTRGETGEATPKPKVQRNLTDSDSRVMMDTSTGSYQQGYNSQIAVDAHGQIILASRVTQEPNDCEQLVPTLAAVKENVGQMPTVASADKGYYSARAITHQSLKNVDLYVPPNPVPKETGGSPVSAAARTSMREKLNKPGSMEIYKTRNTTVEPVFAHIKHVRGYRQFLLRGLEKVEAEWSLICMTHNLLKLFRAGKQLPAA